MAGGMGCLIGTLTLALAIPAARPLIYLMGSPELFVVMLWGLSMVAVLAGRRPIKGLIAAALGLLLATVGQQAQSGIMRFVFDQPYLLDGISISIIALAMFGIPSALDLALTKLGVEQKAVPLKGRLFDGVKDTLRNWWLVLRCSFVGVWVGIVPGLGSQVVDWLAYGHAAQSSKGGQLWQRRRARSDRSRERQRCQGRRRSCYHAAYGVPAGGGNRAFYRRAARVGFCARPGDGEENPKLIYSVVWLARDFGIIGTLVGFVLAAQLAKLAEVRYTFMVPIMFIFILMGAFSVNRDPVDLLVVIAFGVLGYFMRRYGYPRPAMILGLVLAI